MAFEFGGFCDDTRFTFDSSPQCLSKERDCQTDLKAASGEGLDASTNEIARRAGLPGVSWLTIPGSTYCKIVTVGS